GPRTRLVFTLTGSGRVGLGFPVLFLPSPTKNFFAREKSNPLRKACPAANSTKYHPRPTPLPPVSKFPIRSVVADTFRWPYSDFPHFSMDAAPFAFKGAIFTVTVL